MMSPAGEDLGPAEGGSDRVNILIVDDRPSNLLSLQGILARPDYNLVLANSGDEALSHVLRRDFAVILLDVAMPGIDGFQTASLIRQRDRSNRIPIIFVTASVFDIESVFRGYTVGAVDYLQKPVDPHAVRAKVSVFVELFRQARRIEAQAQQLRDVEVRERDRLRRRAEEALEASEAQYRATFDEAPVGIGHIAPDGTWLRGNKRLTAILGGAGDGDLVGHHFLEWLPDQVERETLSRALAALLEGDVPRHAGEIRLLDRNGRLSWSSVTLSALRDRSGAARQVIAILEDVTERKQIEAERARQVLELRDALQSRDDFLSIAAHELRTPLTPLCLQARNLLRELERDRDAKLAPERLRRSLEMIDRATVRLESLIDTLLDLSRIRVGRLTLEREEVDIAALAREVLDRLREQAERAGSAITLHADRPVVGRWDRLRLDQAMTNILTNAIKYGAGKPIDIEVDGDEQVGRFSVRDHGIGIAPEEQARIFDRFERVVSVRHFGGFGLGLWIVRQIIDAHGGQVEVWSRPGEGSRFSLSLPRHPVQEAEDESEFEPTDPGGCRVRLDAEATHEA